MQALADLGPQFDLKTGLLKQKKVKKEKTPQEEAAKDIKAFEKKTLIFIKTAVSFSLSCETVFGQGPPFVSSKGEMFGQ